MARTGGDWEPPPRRRLPRRRHPLLSAPRLPVPVVTGALRPAPLRPLQGHPLAEHLAPLRRGRRKLASTLSIARRNLKLQEAFEPRKGNPEGGFGVDAPQVFFFLRVMRHKLLFF